MATGAPLGLVARNFGWRHAGRQAWALAQVDFDISPGERVLLLGTSGSGKSTLLAAAAGLFGPSTFQAEGIAEHPHGGQSRGELMVAGIPAAQARLSGHYPVGLLLQDPQSQTILARCGDDIAFGLENLGVPRAEIWPRVQAAADWVGFPYPLNRATAALSGGERQRLALAGVMALKPGMLLLDEPTAMLDPAGADTLRQSVHRLLQETEATCIVVEHRVDPWLEFLDRVIVISPQGVIADGPIGPTLAAHARALTAAGVWLPTDLAPRRMPIALAAPGPELLRAEHETGVELRLPAGQAVCLTGANGSGKTTWALEVAGLTVPKIPVQVSPELAQGASGPPHKWPPRKLITRIGTVFQQPEVQFVCSTVQAELALGAQRAGPAPPGAAARPSVVELLDRLRLGHLAAAHPVTLSGGEQRRLSVATALATAPRLLVLDEPTFGQDRRTWGELVDFLAELLAQGVGLLAMTHDLELVVALGGVQQKLPPRIEVQQC